MTVVYDLPSKKKCYHYKIKCDALADGGKSHLASAVIKKLVKLSSAFIVNHSKNFEQI